MKENSLNLLKEIDIQVQEAQGVPTSWTQRGPHQARHIIIKMPKVEDKERILKRSKRKEFSYLQRSTHNTIS